MLWYQDFDQVREEQLPQVEVRCEEPMAPHTTFRIGGPARRMVLPATAEEAVLLLRLSEERGWPVLLLGGGSNLLVADEGVDCLVIATASLQQIAVNEASGIVTAGAGVRLARLAVAAADAGLGGIVFAHGIPGTVGGAVFMNAGAYGGEMAQVVESVTAWLPGKGLCTLHREELDFGYRRSRFSGGEGVILSAVFRLERGCTSEALRRDMEELIRRRRASQPLELPSAGSTFKRPEGYYAGTLIDRCGLKGLSVGGAAVSEKHAGFVVNRGGATCADVTALIAEIQRRVLEETGVGLETEVRIVN